MQGGLTMYACHLFPSKSRAQHSEGEDAGETGVDPTSVLSGETVAAIPLKRIGACSSACNHVA